MGLLDFLEPEEAVGNVWHDFATRLAPDHRYEGAAVNLSDIRASVGVLFRALGGNAGVDIAAAPAIRIAHRRRWCRLLGHGVETGYVASYDGERLRLPPVMDVFASRELNKAAFLWLSASAALTDVSDLTLPDDPQANDWAQIRANAAASERAFRACPGLRGAYARLCTHILAMRSPAALPVAEAAMERVLRDQLGGRPLGVEPRRIRGYRSLAPVPIWLRFAQPGTSGPGSSDPQAQTGAQGIPTSTRKMGDRRDLDQANRRDSFIVHRFESILSWVESMNINRVVEDDDDENAQKAAEDQDSVSLSRHDRKAATRLKLHLDLSPQEAEHERLAGQTTYPEWNHRTRSYMPDHARVLEAPIQIDPAQPRFTPDRRRIAAVRRQFDALRPRRILMQRQIDGQELDLDAVIAARAELQATGRGSDRIYMASRQTARDLSVAILVDTSRSTDAAMGETCVIDVARDALAALAQGIDVSGDRLGIWGFSSLKRHRVFLSRCKGFEQPMSPEIMRNICALRPGQYTRLGAAIRHTAAQLSGEQSSRRLLLVLTDGKPNDLDHYDGQHGIEDSHMAVREARRMGLTVHGVVVDEDGQDWFPRIFGKGGFTLLPNPARLTRALPDIYRALTQET